MDGFDRSIVGANLKGLRQLAGLSQEEVARLSGVGVASVSRLERGLIVRLGTINKLCAALRTDLSIVTRTQKFKNLVTVDNQYVLHRRAEQVWTKRFDKRRRAPTDDESRIQDAQERLRLGSLGLVAMFQATLNFVMPRGPQVILEEICGPTTYGPTLNYRDYVIFCLRGRVLVRLEQEELRLNEGDAMGYMNGLSFVVEPIDSTGPRERYPLVLRIGANRMGRKGKNA